MVVVNQTIIYVQKYMRRTPDKAQKVMKIAAIKCNRTI